MNSQSSFDMNKVFAPKDQSHTNYGYEHSSIFNASGETNRQNLRNETRFALEYSKKFNFLSLLVSLAKISVSIYLIIPPNGEFCGNKWVIWLLCMTAYDLFNVTIISLRINNIIQLSEEELISSRGLSHSRNGSMHITMVGGDPSNNSQNNSRVSHLEEENKKSERHQPLAYQDSKISSSAVHILRERRTIAVLSKIAKPLYLGLLVCGQVFYLMEDRTLCYEKSININVVVTVYLIMAYFWFVGPILLLVVSAVFIPCLLFIIFIFGKPNKRAGGQVDLNKLTLKNYSAGIGDTSDCEVCMMEYQEGDKVVVLGCNPKHFLHEACLHRWLKISTQCPMCMAKIEGEEEQAPAAEKLDAEAGNQAPIGGQSATYVQLTSENSLKAELIKHE